MNIDIPTDYLEIINQIAAKGGETTEETINSSIRFFIMIHFMPYEDQTALRSILQKTYPETELKGFH